MMNAETQFSCEEIIGYKKDSFVSNRSPDNTDFSSNQFGQEHKDLEEEKESHFPQVEIEQLEPLGSVNGEEC